MHRNQTVSISRSIVFILVVLNVVIIRTAYIGNAHWYWALTISGPLLLIAFKDIYKKKAPMRNYPSRFYRRIKESESKSFNQI